MLPMQRKTPKRTHAQELVRLRTGRELPELLHDLWVEQRLSQGAISEELGVSRITVAMWLREYGIERAEASA